MRTLIEVIKNGIRSNRIGWVSLMVEGYGLDSPELWKCLGYTSKLEFRRDLMLGRNTLPTATHRDK